MTDYVFVLGNNWTLSIAELIVLLHDLNLPFELKDHTRNIAVVSIEKRLKIEDVIDIQESMGGCFKIGRVVQEYPREIVQKAFPMKGRIQNDERAILRECTWLNQVWPRVKGNRIKFGVSTYPVIDGETDIDLRKLTLALDEWIKQRLVKNGAKKASFVVYDEPDRRKPSRQNTALWPKSIAKHSLLKPPNSEILAALMEDRFILAKTIVVYDSVLQQYRDESRPFISSEISTSPKISRTLLTLAGVKREDTILDPFCGTGTLLMEAALLGMKVIGIDIDGNAVQGAEKNLVWLGKDIGTHVDFRIIRGDARNSAELVGEQVDAVAFEPDLGPIYKTKPTLKEVNSTLNELTDLYNKTLRSISSILRENGRVAFTLPEIKSDEGRKGIRIEEVIKGTNFEVMPLLPKELIIHSAPIDKKLKLQPDRRILPERKRGQIVQRSIVVLSKF